VYKNNRKGFSDLQPMAKEDKLFNLYDFAFSNAFLVVCSPGAQCKVREIIFDEDKILHGDTFYGPLE